MTEKEQNVHESETVKFKGREKDLIQTHLTKNNSLCCLISQQPFVVLQI